MNIGNVVDRVDVMSIQAKEYCGDSCNIKVHYKVWLGLVLLYDSYD